MDGLASRVGFLGEVCNEGAPVQLSGDVDGPARPLLGAGKVALAGTLVLLLAIAVGAIVRSGTVAGMPEACTVPPAGLVGWWPGDGTAGDMTGGNDGLAHGALFAAGRVDEAFSLDGQDDYVLVVENPAVPLDGFQEMTVEGWIWPDDYGWPNPDPSSAYEATILSKYDSTEDGGISYHLSLSDGRLRFVVFGEGDPQPVVAVLADGQVALGAWSHVAAVWRGQAQLELYVNGQQLAATVTFSNGTPSSVADTDTPVNLGRVESYSGGYVGPAAFFDGLLDEITVYERGLSGSEIAAIYAGEGKCKDGRNGPGARYLPVVMKPVATATATPVPSPSPIPSWLGHLNSLREMAALPPVSENPKWSDGCWLHARYAVKNDKTGHTEDPTLPWYTPEGLACAQSANLSYSSNVNRSDQDALDGLMTAPFHGVGMIDPALRQSAFGSYREADGGLQHVVALDVIRGHDAIPASVSFPIMWPAQETVSPLAHFDGRENPDPLASCPGYSGPTGAPIILQIGPGNRTPDVTNVSVTYAGTVVQRCVFDETNYYNPDADAQALGRAVLNSRDAIVIIPRYPLVPGGRYYVSVSTNGDFHSWSFTVADNPRQYRLLEGGEFELVEGR